MNAKPTPGPWGISWGHNYIGGQAHYCVVGTNEPTKKEDGEPNAALIVAAVNACFAINPDNPLAVAEGMMGLVEACREASRQLGEFYDEAMLRDVDGSRPRNKLEIQLRAALAKLEA